MLPVGKARAAGVPLETRATVRSRFPLLPANTTLGWTPYAWLIYLPTFLIEPIARTQAGRAHPLYWAVTIGGLALFLLTYFRGYWVRGVRLVPIVAVQTALGLAFAPYNPGATVFFVYAASFAARFDRQRDAIRGIVAVTLFGVFTALLIDADLYVWITATMVTLLVGGVNLHFAQAGQAQHTLMLAHQEIEHLATVAERERISRDLHDVLGHTLSLIVLKSELAARLAEQDPARAATEIRDVEQVARRTLQDVRHAIRGYRPALDDEVARARTMLKAARIVADIDITPVPPLARPIEEALALALREAVTNVVRHSGASRCTAQLRIGGGQAVLHVADDGRGSASPPGLGLRGMQERIAALDGTLERVPGRGMQLVIRLPVADGSRTPEVTT